MAWRARGQGARRARHPRRAGSSGRRPRFRRRLAAHLPPRTRHATDGRRRSGHSRFRRARSSGRATGHPIDHVASAAGRGATHGRRLDGRRPGRRTGSVSSGPSPSSSFFSKEWTPAPRRVWTCCSRRWWRHSPRAPTSRARFIKCWGTKRASRWCGVRPAADVSRRRCRAGGQDRLSASAGHRRNSG